MHRIPGTDIVFVHIPKTAGIAIRRAFGMRTVAEAHSTNTARDQRLMAPRFIRFCVIRHPIERFVSAFLYNRWYSDQNPTGVRGVIQKVGATEDINRFIDAARQGEVKLGRFSHFRAQTRFIMQTRPQIILRHENLSQDIRIIGQLVGKPDITLPPQNRATDRAADLRDVNTAISERNLDYLRKHYQADLELLGYETDSALKKIAPKTPGKPAAKPTPDAKAKAKAPAKPKPDKPKAAKPKAAKSGPTKPKTAARASAGS